MTVQYPEQQKPMSARFRGRHNLKRYEDTGLERCIGCALCAAACPADAIYVEAAENTNEARYLSRRALRQHLRDQHAALHLLRLLRRCLPDKRDRAGADRIPNRLHPREHDLQKRDVAGRTAKRLARHTAKVEPGKFDRAILPFPPIDESDLIY